jgi:hypothetical protein
LRTPLVMNLDRFGYSNERIDHIASDIAH